MNRTNPNLFVKLTAIAMLLALMFSAKAQNIEYVDTKVISGTVDKSIIYTQGVTITPNTTISSTNGDFFISPFRTNPTPSPNENYVRVELPRVPTSTESSLTTMNAGEKTTSYTYNDGLGRRKLGVVANGGSNYEDIVQYYEYNNSTGRQEVQYLPYAKTYANPGAFHASAKTDQEGFYDGTNNIPNDSKPFTQTEFNERSQASASIAAGQEWNSDIDAEDKKVTYAYKVYDPTDPSAGIIQHWKINASSLENDRQYTAHELNIVEVTDEEGKKSRTVNDMRGLTITSQVYDEAAGKWVGSYNVYDDYRRLRYIIPPLVVNSLSGPLPRVISTNILSELTFQFEYDKLGRLKKEKAPGAGWIEYVYDKWDRLVLSRHEAQQFEGVNSWTFFKYDMLNRLVVSGEVKTNLTQTDLQNRADVSTKQRYESASNSAVDYTHTNSFPDLSNSDYADHELLTINYFDDYDFVTWSTWDTEQTAGTFEYSAPSGFTGAKSTAVLDQVTGSKVKILGSNTWLNTVIYYDSKLRVLQTIAENHLGGVDRLTNELNWNGRLEKLLVQHSGNQSVDILNEYEYAHNDQLLRNWQTITEAGNANTGERLLVAEYNYDLLNQVVEKNLHSIDGSSFLQSVDYDYNIRGWTSAINNSNLDDGEGDLFGMNYNYTSTSNINGSDVPGRYDGLVSSMTWNSDNDPQQSGIQGQKSILGFNYDEQNRLKNSKYATDNAGSWTGNPGHYDMSADYDDNGNIQNLTRKSEGNTIDNLTYGYETNSNKLKYVDDSSNNPEGFNNRVASGGTVTEYTYDDMGNTVEDDNKDIITIRYNHLQLVEYIEFFDYTKIEVTYDAVGNKLSKVVKDADNNIIGKVDYVGLVEYYDDEVNQIFTSEGRAYRQNDKYHYEYFLTDHQGSSRVAFGNLPERHVYTATMESEYSSNEESEFAFPTGIRTTAQNHTPLGNESVALNGTIAGREVGPAKVLTIANGDEVDLAVWAKYTFNSWNNTTIADIATTVASTFGGASAGTGAESASSALNSALADPGAAGLFTGNASGEPQAYLQYLFFDASYNYVSANSGFVAVGADSEGKFSKLQTANTLTFNETGYLFVYLVNESNQNADVFFDDFKITHASGTQNFKVTQVNEYYPFGLATKNSWRDPGYVDPGLLYQSVFNSYDSIAGTYDFFLRNYDPALGRWLQVDPYNQFASPYIGMGNFPHLGVDPNGGVIIPAFVWQIVWQIIQNVGIPAAATYLATDAIIQSTSASGPSIGSGTRVVEGLLNGGDGLTQSLRNPFMKGPQTELGPELASKGVAGIQQAPTTGYILTDYVVGTLDGTIAGIKSTASFVQSLGTSAGWLGVWRGVQTMGELMNPYSTQGTLMKVQMAADAVQYVNNIPNMTAYEIGYAVGFAQEKVAETVLLTKGVSVVGNTLKGSNYAYRALTASDVASINAGKGIVAKAPNGIWTLEEHLIRGSSPKAWIDNPWIATSKDINIVRAFDGGNGLVKINLSKVPANSIHQGWTTLPRSSPGYHYSIWQQEISIYQNIPQKAITIIK